MTSPITRNYVDKLADAAEATSSSDLNTAAESVAQPDDKRDDLASNQLRATSANTNQTTLWLRRADQLLLGFLLAALLLLLVAFRLKLSGWGRTQIEIVSQQPREYFYTLDVNKASWVEWAQLDGIGEKLARRIVKDREDHGSFKSVNDLRRVRGLGPKLVEKLRPFLQCAESDQVQTE